MYLYHPLQQQHLRRAWQRAACTYNANCLVSLRVSFLRLQSTYCNQNQSCLYYKDSYLKREINSENKEKQHQICFHKISEQIVLECLEHPTSQYRTVWLALTHFQVSFIYFSSIRNCQHLEKHSLWQKEV